MPFLYNLVRVVDWLIYLLSILIVVKALISWLPFLRGGKFDSFLTTMTEPVVAPVRHLLWKVKITRELPVDFSPFIAICLLYVIKDILNVLVISFV